MKRKIGYVLVVFSMVLSITACGSKKGTDQTPQSSTQPEQTETLETQAPQAESEDTEVPEATEASESTEAPEVTAASEAEIYQSDYGYEIKCDRSKFEIYNADGNDTYSLIGQDLNKELPIYIAVQLFTDTDAAEIAEGLKLQSGSDDVEIENTTMGAENYKAKSVYVEVKNDLGTQSISYLAVQNGSDVFLIEAGGYVGEEESISGEIEAMLGSFTME